jgi:PAS domain S-box-containing protein
VNAVVALFNVSSLRRNDEAVAHAREAKTEAARLAAEVADAETAVRGFVLTGREDLLAPYHAAEAGLGRRIRVLREHLAGTDDSDQLSRLETAAADEFQRMRQLVDARRRTKGAEGAISMLAAGIGRPGVDRLPAALAAVEQEADDLLAERARTADAGYRFTGYATVMGGGLTLGMAAMAYALARRELAGRKRAEAAALRAADELARSQQVTADTLAMLDTFLTNAPIGIAFFDREFRYVRINEHLAAANGRPVADHLGRPVREAVPDLPAEILADLEAVAATGQSIVNRLAVGRPGDPSRVWLSSYFPVRAPNGRFLGVGVIAQDVTERRANEARLIESEARKSAILAAALDAVIAIDHEGRVIEFNPAAERTCVYTRAEAMGRDLADLIIPPAHREDYRRGLAHYLATGEGRVLNRRIEMPARRKDGSEFPAELAVTAVSLAGRPVFTAYLRDITERKLADDALRQSRDRFRTLVEAVPQMVCVSDPAGAVVQVNARWVEVTGLKLARTPDWLAPVHPSDLPAARNAWEQALRVPPDHFAHECRIRAGDGEYRWMLVGVVPLRDANGDVAQWVATFTDIEDQKRQSETLGALVRMRTAELVSSNQLLREEIGERTQAEERAQLAVVELGRSNQELEKFAYVASHDLQEPLRKIQAFGDRLTKKYRDILGTEGQEYVDRMRAAADRMRTLINDLLTFSRVTTKGQPFAPVDLGQIVADVLSDLETRVVQTEGKVDVGLLPTVAADALQMRQLFQNLTGNALKFHKPGVPPVVTIRSAPWVALKADADPPAPVGAGYRITVADNGIGFEPEYADRVFEMFQRLHARGEFEGTGIGLAICRKIVQRHGGEITARGRPGEGATFIIDLPARAG